VCAQSGAPPRDGDAPFVSIQEPKLPHAAMQSLRATPNIAGRRAIDAAGSRTSPSTRRAATRSPVKSTAYLTVDPDQYDPDANSGRGSGFVPGTQSSGAVSSGVRPSRVTRGADGVVYDPDQYDADANQRSGQAASRPSGGSARQTEGSNTVDPRFALLFDCDGVIVETEELHRKAYNASFKHFGLTIPASGKVEW
jgi:hypothetical protein